MKDDAAESDIPGRAPIMPLLKYYPVTHGGIRKVYHPELDTMIDGQTSIRYLRFFRQVRIDILELSVISGGAESPMGGSGRLIPDVPTHPAHLIISTLDKNKMKWNLYKEVMLPPDPSITGEGLTQSACIEDMEAYMKKTIQDHTPHIINMEGVVTDNIRIECDREHPVWPNHGEMNGGPYHVPFTILNPLRVFGEDIGWVGEPIYNPILQLKEYNPLPPTGMEIEDRPDMLLFKGKKLSVGFSLRRPIMMHLGWDAFGMGREKENRLRNGLFHERLANTDGFTQPIGLSGPFIRTLNGDYGANDWTGEVRVTGNKIIYYGLKVVNGFEIDAIFTIQQESIQMDLTLRGEQNTPVIEFELWRFAWDVRKAMTGAAGVPTLTQGRNGEVRLPLIWAGDGVGGLLCSAPEFSETWFQVESYRRYDLVTGGIRIGPNPAPEECMQTGQGRFSSSVMLKVVELGPKHITGGANAGIGMLSRWSAPFSCFRPEYGGFSNNSISVNCHVNQVTAIETIVNTKNVCDGLNLIELARFTIERALLDGGGYGYFRNLFHDSDPSLISTAGQIYQASPDDSWLKKIEPGLIAAVDRMLRNLNEDGLIECRSLTGNSGSFRWSSNAMDVIGFGHLDAYVNALSYRAFMNAVTLLKILGHYDHSQRCKAAATGIHKKYSSTFINPKTGWVSGWKSKDGALHDYAFVWINGPAIAFGLLDKKEVHTALSNLEQLRKEMRISSARLGVPSNLIPIDPKDHMLPKILGEHTRIYENYTDGSLGSYSAFYYLRALSIYGFKQEAKQMAKDLDDAFAWGIFDGGNYSGKEFKSWEGLSNGYEGTFFSSFGCLYAIAVEQGAIEPFDPEWWPKEPV